MPVGYFLIDKTIASVQASLVKTALTMAHQYGLKVWCVTSDHRTTTNLAMFELLGCSLVTAYESIVTMFPHPSTGSEVFAILDVCHMIKLSRNFLSFLGTCCGEFGEKIEWKYICALHQLQQQEGIKMSNKLTTEHIQFEKHKKNVSLAAQTLSSSVADAIDFLNNILKRNDFKRSKGSQVYKNFTILDQRFDIFNSRNPYGKEFKQ